MKIFTCAFFGHRDFNDHIICEPKLMKLLNDILSKHEFTEFLVGRNGEFDRFAASLVHRIKGDNCSMTLVLPYITVDFSENQQAFENYHKGLSGKGAYRRRKRLFCTKIHK